MFLSIVLALAYTITVVQADITCLQYGLLSPILGLFCHFEPSYFHAAENSSAVVVEEAVKSVENLVKFDLTHNPAVVAYNFIDQTNKGGLSQGGQYLGNVTQDFEDVAIGFGKQTANSVITIVELTYWNDLSICLINGAAGLALRSQQKQRMTKRIGLHGTSAPPRGHRMSMVQPRPNDAASVVQPSANQSTAVHQPQANEAVTMAQGCLSDKFKQLAKPAVFHINNTNQKIGSTISDLAALLVPVAGEEKVAAEAADALTGAVDLAIPGSESTTRVVKMVAENTGDHFASEKEARTVAENMKEKSWVKENCGICGNSPAPLSNLISKRDLLELNRRGNMMASCCRLPHVAEVEGPDPYAHLSEAEREFFNPKEYRTITDADLVPPPQLSSRNIQLADDLKALKNDLSTQSTGLLEWSPELSGAMGSDELLATLRQIFKGKQDSKLYQALKIRSRDNGYRMYTNTLNWLRDTDPVLQPLQAWANAAIKDGIDAVATLKGFKGDIVNHMRGQVEFFYTAPNKRALTGTDPRGFHIDTGQMQFGIADVPGLVVVNSATKTASRVPLAKNAFHLLKAQRWAYDAIAERLPEGPTWHSVFGQEMAEKGRVSIIMSVEVPMYWFLKDL